MSIEDEFENNSSQNGENTGEQPPVEPTPEEPLTPQESPTPSEPSTPEEPLKPKKTIESIVSPALLQMLAKASGGFTIIEDHNMPPGSTGFTNKLTKEIHLNALYIHGYKSDQVTIEPWRDIDIRGLCFHECGHHAKQVLALDDQIFKEISNPDIIPESYRGSARSEQKFIGATYRHLNNAVVDMWLESFMTRRPYYTIRKDITEFQSAKGEWDDYHSLSMPEQLMQTLLRSRYQEQPNLEQKVDPDVYQAFQRLYKTGAMKTLCDISSFEHYFATPADHERAIERKTAAFRQMFLPEYLSLMEKELEKRKQQKQQEKQKSSGKGEKGEEGEKGQGSGGSGGEESEPQEGEEPQVPQPSEAVPLTDEEEQELIEQILEEIEKAGKEFEEIAPSDDDEKKKEARKQKIWSEIEAKHEPKGDKPKPTPEPDEEPKGIDRLRELAARLQRESKAEKERGKAEALGVKQESVKEWERIKTERRDQIESTANALAEVFLDDRRKKRIFNRKHGEITPGQEAYYISARFSGDPSPSTHEQQVRNPEFLETEIEFILDQSGSMSGDKLNKSIETMVVVVEAFRRVMANLAAENLLNKDEVPFRIGVTGFTTEATRISSLDEPITEKKQLEIIDKASVVGGGTEETGALTEVYKGLMLRKHNVIKIIIVLTDGAGNVEGVAPIMRQIEQDDQVIFLALGLGEGEYTNSMIATTYLQPLKNREKNVYGMTADDPSQILPGVTTFIKKEVGKRKT